MKTFDGVELVMRHIRLGEYPADSLTRRDIIATIPAGKDPEATIAKINTQITSAIFSYIDRSQFKNQPKVAVDELTDLVVSATKD